MIGSDMTRILLVDDDPNLRTLLTKILVKNQFDLTCAKNGAAGLEQAKALKPDLIILDIITSPPSLRHVAGKQPPKPE
jgi:DNA-binding response OmpR family regulator